MRYVHYKAVVERKFKKSLKEIMFETCVVESLTAKEGARKLGVAKEVFMSWRQHYRLERKQLLFEAAISEMRKI